MVLLWNEGPRVAREPTNFIISSLPSARAHSRRRSLNRASGMIFFSELIRRIAGPPASYLSLSLSLFLLLALSL